MKFSSFTTLSLLLARAIALPTILTADNVEKKLGARQNSDFATAAGSVFKFNGKKQYFAGTNAYYISFLSDKADVDLIMQHVTASKLKVLRVWGFNDVSSVPSSGHAWFQSFVYGKTPVINTGADGLQRLDYIVQSASKYGIRLIIPFVNNWDDYGGMNVYSNFYGIDKKSWYTHSGAQAQYQKYIATVVKRYANSTAIFAWELANEPRCNYCATSVITEWARKTSAYIKSLDQNHMVTIGDEGFGMADSDTSYPFQYVEGIDWETNLKISTIDFGTAHLYPDQWGQSASWGSYWITAHAKAAARAGKPFLFEEYGYSSKSELGPWQSTILSTATAGDLYWQHGDQLSSGQTHNDGYSIYHGSSEYQTYVTNHAAEMAAKT